MSNASSRYCRECKENLDGLQTWFKQTRTKEEEQCLRDALDNERFRIQCIERYASAQRNATEWPTFEDSIIKIAEGIKQRKLAAAAEKKRKKQIAKLQKQLAGADDYDPEGADDYDLPGADDYPPSVWQWSDDCQPPGNELMIWWWRLAMIWWWSDDGSRGADDYPPGAWQWSDDGSNDLMIGYSVDWDLGSLWHTVYRICITNTSGI